jgi:hypothetical protein
VQAIVNTGLQRIYDAFTKNPAYAVAFLNTSSNWQTVILGGTVMATLAVQGEIGVPVWVDELLPLALDNLNAYSAKAWGSDGAWPEGPNYGGYTARYLVPTVASAKCDRD